MTYYIWIWDGQQAYQVAYPVIEFSRCSITTGTFTGLPDGFEIETKLKSPRAPCLENGTIPATMAVGVRDKLSSSVEAAYRSD